MYYLYLCLFYPLALLPMRALYWLSNLLYIILYKCVGYRTAIVRGNLRRSFPGAAPGFYASTERAFYRHLCDNIVETIKLLHISDEEILRRIEVVGASLVEQAAGEGKPIMLLLGHYGNWEYVSSISWHYSRPAKSGQIYRPLRDKGFDRLMLRVRDRFHTESIPQKKAVRRLLELRRDYGSFIIGFIADQHPNSPKAYHWTTFLGQDTAFVTGAEEIGNKMNAAMMYLDVERKERRGHYRLTFKPITPLPDGQPYPYTRAYMQMLEQTIKRQPAYWLWSHRRWLMKREPCPSQPIDKQNEQSAATVQPERRGH